MNCISQTVRQTVRQTVKQTDTNKKEEKENKEENTYSEEQKIIFSKFNEWINCHTSRINKLPKPFTINECLTLHKFYKPQDVKEYLYKMENWEPLLKKEHSAYLTILNWLKKDKISKITN